MSVKALSVTKSTAGALTGAALVEQIHSYHEACERAVGDALSHAMAAGDLLAEAKRQCKHGEWERWVVENCQFSERTARTYMRLAKNRPAIEQNGSGSAVLTIDKAPRAHENAPPLLQSERGEIKRGNVMDSTLATPTRATVEALLARARRREAAREISRKDPNALGWLHRIKCWQCGELFGASISLSRYCSRACTYAARRERWKWQRPDKTTKCEQCGKEFKPVRFDAKFCSSACRQKNYRAQISSHSEADIRNARAAGGRAGQLNIRNAGEGSAEFPQFDIRNAEAGAA